MTREDFTLRDFLIALGVLALLALVFGCASSAPIDGACVGGPKHAEPCSHEYECWGGECRPR